jgi:hypothetical protein
MQIDFEHDARAQLKRKLKKKGERKTTKEGGGHQQDSDQHARLKKKSFY